jgi:serine phosphatase RsbU (regulator of sigma subunit)
VASNTRSVFFAVFGFIASFVHAAPSAAAAPPAPTNTAPSATATAIRLGDSVAPLNGPWKFQIGDSPIDPKTGQPLWAEPDFDDSHWETVDITPPSGSFDPIAGTSGYVPGWTAKGHHGYFGFAWYRIRFRLEAPADQKLALAGPSDVDDVYQVFDNGKLLGAFGDFSKSPPGIYTARFEMFALPAEINSGNNTRVLAFRVWMDPYTLTQLDDVGGFHNPPLVGVTQAISAQHQVKWDELYRSYAGSLIEALVFSLLGAIALSLILFDRTDPVYFWIGALLFMQAANGYLLALATWTEWIPYFVIGPVRKVLILPLIFAGWVMVWRVWFRQRRVVWVPWLLAVLLALLFVSNYLGQNFFFVSTSVDNAFHLASLVIRLGIAALLLLTVFVGIREQGLEGWLAVPAVLLAGLSEFTDELSFTRIVPIWFPFGVQLGTRQMADLLLAATLSVLLVRRLVLSLRRQRQMALDVKQAQEVQQVILPETRTAVPGLEIESEYRPALEVGGDFFQIIPNDADGSLLIVAGDVAGKGLKAGMLVALLVGAIRSTAESESDPSAILAALNRRLMGRGDARATCLALRIARNGAVTLANAGHMPPYLNGVPLDIPGSLPLGLIEQVDCSVRQFSMAESDRLLLLSDGVAEATDKEGKLFGFDRVLELIRTEPTAAKIADVAQAFGQEDDISVIAVTRIAVAEPALA